MKPSKVYSKFLDLIVEVAEKREGTVEWMKPVFDEVGTQIETQQFDKGRLASAVEKARRNVGYHTDYNECFSFLLSKWPKTTVTTVTEKKIGSKWEEMVQKNQMEQREKLEKVKKSKMKEVLEVTEESSELRFEEAFETLRLQSCESWFKYLQSTGKVLYAGSLGKEKEAFFKCQKVAAQLIDPLLEKRTIYDDSQAVESDLKGAMSSQNDDAMINVVLAHYGLTDPKTPVYWFAKGMILHMNPKMTIRCDGSAALAFYYLATTKLGFDASIALVRQGDPRWSGHWFLVAGVANDLAVENINSLEDALSKKKLKKSWCFVIDLWGAAFQKAKTTVGFPAFCVAGDWKMKLMWTV